MWRCNSIPLQSRWWWAPIPTSFCIISNLLSNAVKFFPSGGEVFVKVKNLGTMGRLSVCDQGPGVPDDYKTRILEKFIQVDAASPDRNTAC